MEKQQSLFAFSLVHAIRHFLQLFFRSGSVWYFLPVLEEQTELEYTVHAWLCSGEGERGQSDHKRRSIEGIFDCSQSAELQASAASLVSWLADAYKQTYLYPGYTMFMCMSSFSGMFFQAATYT